MSRDKQIRRCALAACLILATGTAVGSDCTDEVVGYYPSWAMYLPYLPSDIDWVRLTQVNHAFLGIHPDAAVEESPDYAATRPALIAEAQANGVVVLASVAGWSGCTGRRLQEIAADPLLRASLAENLATYCTTHGYDGVTLDWEFPGMAYGSEPLCNPLGKDPTRCAIDRANFTLLSAEIRARFDEEDPPLRLQTTLPLTAWFGECYDAGALAAFYDRMEIMAYDMHGDWSGHVGHNAPLHEPSWDPHGGVLSVEGTLDYWNILRGLDLGGLLIGLPFYGYEYPLACAPGHPEVSGMISRPYREIVADFLSSGWTRVFDVEAQTPYLVRDTGCGLLFYDDLQSLAAKVEFGVSRGVRGFMIWDLSQDDPPLLPAVADDLQPCCLVDPDGDCDADGETNQKDCEPLDPGVLSPPGPVVLAGVARSGSDAVLTWTGLAGAAGDDTVYDVAGGSLAGLHQSVPDAICLADDEPSTTLIDTRPIPPGGLFFLVRGQNACGTGDYGRASIDSLQPCN